MKDDLKPISRKITVIVIIAIIFACSLFTLIYYKGTEMIRYYFLTSKYIYEQETPYIENFRKYVEDHNIGIDDVDKYNEWIVDNNISFLSVEKDGIQRYSLMTTDGFIQQSKDMYDYRMINPFRQTVQFSDTEAEVFIYANYTEKYYTYFFIADFAFSMIISFLIILWQVRRIIKHLQAELAEAEGKAKSVRTDKDSLLRSMAHDLRTHLTGLMSYLDIIKNGNISGKDEAEYIGVISAKAVEIKDLTDQLFDFTLASSEDTIETDEPMDVQYAIGDYLSEMCMELAESKISVNIDKMLWKNVKVIVSGRFMGRIFSNLTSNIKKYADTSKVVSLETIYCKHSIIIKISNYISDNKKLLESAGIGLKNIEMMMQRMNGKFVYDSNDENGIFMVMLEFNIIE